MFETIVDRRNFLRGSALFAVAIGLSVAAPALAQQRTLDEDPDQQKPDEKKDPFAPDEKSKSGEKSYVDKDGREYRICPQCAYNMYKQGRMWVCENCGYSYVE
ncbi:MAG: twin-arginine translocation signal domain-containing protein [Acidobacteriota bacterium]